MRSICIAMTLVVVTLPTHALAQEPLTPPRVLELVPATLEPEALGERTEVAVLFEVDIGVDGSVTAARILESAGDPFDPAALEAMMRFRFEPARRGEVPIPARIRYRYVLSPPPAAQPSADVVSREEPPERQEPVRSDTAAEPAPEPEFESAPESDAETESEPVFTASAVALAPPREPTRHEIDRRDVQSIAGAHGDPLRAAQMLPGVGVDASTSNGVVVRGSHPLDTTVMLEGSPVPVLNHVGGYTSFFNARLLDSVQLYPSNFSVRYGRALGAAIEVTVRDQFAEGFHGGADLNVIDASVFAEGQSGPVGAAIAARRSHIDAFWGLIFGDDLVVRAPTYYDYQAIVRWDLSPDDRLRLLVYGTHDELRLSFDEPRGDPRRIGNLGTQDQTHRGQLEWRHRYSDEVQHDVRLMAGYRAYDQQVGEVLQASASGLEMTSRGEWSIRMGELGRWIVGFDVWLNGGDYSYRGPPSPASEGDPGGFDPADPQVLSEGSLYFVRTALYIEAPLVLTEGWTLVPGFRLDHLGDVDTWSPEPRLSTRLELTETTTVRAGVGVFGQPPQWGRTLEGFGNPDLGPERAIHSTLGIVQDIEGVVRIALDGYHKWIFDRVVPTADGGPPHLVNDGVGNIYGGELSARWTGDRHFTGYFSYALSRSERREDGEWRLFDYDQTHILTTALSYDFGEGWELGASFRLISGTPYTPVVGAVYDAREDRYQPIYGALNSARNPLWHRLDIRAAKTFEIDTHARLQIYVDVMNATNHRAEEGASYNFDYRHSAPSQGLPIIPSLGIRGEL